MTLKKLVSDQQLQFVEDLSFRLELFVKLFYELFNDFFLLNSINNKNNTGSLKNFVEK